VRPERVRAIGGAAQQIREIDMTAKFDALAPAFVEIAEEQKIYSLHVHLKNDCVISLTLVGRVDGGVEPRINMLRGGVDDQAFNERDIKGWLEFATQAADGNVMN
jgi:hypothetical protein